MKDVGAVKGFLICTSGFAKSNHTYARALAIELLTVEDMESDKWRPTIRIPLIYIKKTLNCLRILLQSIYRTPACNCALRACG